MTEQLPITINVNNGLSNKFLKIKSICHKLEALFNFQTLKANWYGDEEEILTIKLCLETPVSFTECQGRLNKLTAGEVIISPFSDDVISCLNESEQQLLCYIAVTDSELVLLEQQPKLLTGLLQVKLNKVLNLIANQQYLSHI
ncbi:hypothetical protein [Colwellia psychrerythraea]|uniref:Uncharacterized protein n=1 Tax=Colwellia psychrerythraea TaxID=28229 RepID=A0A099KNH1_COLPS|nr:hypothetical protein [Colwellia psychrerythraea]KGJ91163.1 hypothetical protein GAB14E_3315 [Colwellia psychrerythraea]